MLIPNNRQETKLFQYAGTARFAYNWALSKEQENHKNGGKFISDNDLRKEFTILKHTDEYAWLNNVSNNVTKQAIKDACESYKRFFKGLSKFPKYKSKKKSRPSFFQDPIKIKFTNTHVKVEGFAISKKSNKQKLNHIRVFRAANRWQRRYCPAAALMSRPGSGNTWAFACVRRMAEECILSAAWRPLCWMRSVLLRRHGGWKPSPVSM